MVHPRFYRRLFATGCALAILAGCAQENRSVASNPPPVAAGPNATWYALTFDTNSYAIDASARAVLDLTVVALRNHPNETATIIGKTDSVGTPEYNMHLSHLRADAVRDALVYGNQIAADRVETRWTGERRQNLATADGVAAQSNRVVDIALH